MRWVGSHSVTRARTISGTILYRYNPYLSIPCAYFDLTMDRTERSEYFKFYLKYFPLWALRDPATDPFMLHACAVLGFVVGC